MIKMTIELTDKGIFVEGPLQDKPLCYALLRGAEKILEEYPKNRTVLAPNPAASGPVRSN